MSTRQNDDDIDLNWETYKAKFLEGELP